MIQLCDAHIGGPENFPDGIGTDIVDATIFDDLLEMAPGYNDTMWYCKWRNGFYACHDFFRTIITDEGKNIKRKYISVQLIYVNNFALFFLLGICYTFNNLNSDEIYTDQ